MKPVSDCIFSRPLFLLLSAVFIIAFTGCGDSGGMDDGDSGPAVITAPDCPSAFYYEYTAENIHLPFHAYSNTEFRIIQSGECEYSFDLFTYYPDSDSTGWYTAIAKGQGYLDERFFHNLPQNEYLIIPHVLPLADTALCEWRIEVESVFSTCDSGYIDISS